MFGEETVFLSDTSPLLPNLTMRTLVYTEVFFIPREVVLEVVAKYPAVWKYGRWLVARCTLRHWAHGTLQARTSGSNSTGQNDKVEPQASGTVGET